MEVKLLLGYLGLHLINLVPQVFNFPLGQDLWSVGSVEELHIWLTVSNMKIFDCLKGWQPSTRLAQESSMFV